MLEGDKGCTERQAENADIGREPDPEKLARMSTAFAKRYWFDTACLDLASAV
jgi:hypothetical protein